MTQTLTAKRYDTIHDTIRDTTDSFAVHRYMTIFRPSKCHSFSEQKAQSHAPALVPPIMAPNLKTFRSNGPTFFHGP